MNAFFRRLALAGCALTLLVVLSACGLFPGGDDADSPTPSPSAAASERELDSEFTHDGTFQSHNTTSDVDYVFTIWPTKSTPRTNDWYPLGDKNFSFTFQAYDMGRDFRDPFSTKRQTFLQHVKVTSTVTTESGNVTDGPYTLDATAAAITFDPEPVSNQWGMLVTSPKGSFELRNQTIGDLPEDTIGITLRFEATVWTENAAGKPDVTPQVITQEVPIAIFASDTPTEQQEIPKNAN